MKDRIILLIKAKNMTAAQFADEIGVQKSSISHIISGRNNASLDFIQKVLLCYPEVNMEWLMFGKGPLFKGSETTLNSCNDGLLNTISQLSSPSVDLFSELMPGKEPENRKEIDLSPQPKPTENTKHEELENENSFPLKESKTQAARFPTGKTENITVRSGHDNITTKAILKIVEFYSDNTYREYFPE